MSGEQLPVDLEHAVWYCAHASLSGFAPDDDALKASDAIRAKHAQHVTLQHHAADLAQRVADLEAERDRIQSACDNMARGWRADRDALERREVDFQGMLVAEHSVSGAYVDLRSALGAMDPPSTKWPELSRYVAGVARDIVSERDALRVKHDELLVALHGIGKALGIPESDRSPYSVMCGALERVNRLAEIEAQEPAAKIHADGYWTARRGYDPLPDGKAFLSVYARPVPAQSVPDADGARFRWLCEDHSDRETREQCRSLIDRLSGMSYSAAVMSIDAAMAAAPEHKA